MDQTMMMHEVCDMVLLGGIDDGYKRKSVGHLPFLLGDNIT